MGQRGAPLRAQASRAAERCFSASAEGGRLCFLLTLRAVCPSPGVDAQIDARGRQRPPQASPNLLHIDALPRHSYPLHTMGAEGPANTLSTRAPLRYQAQSESKASSWLPRFPYSGRNARSSVTGPTETAQQAVSLSHRVGFVWLFRSAQATPQLGAPLCQRRYSAA